MRRLTIVTDHSGEGRRLKVAFATQDMKQVDAHFGWAPRIAIYDVAPEGHRMVEVVQFEGEAREDGTEDKLGPRIDAIRDCAIVYVAAIGGSAAARVVNSRVHPIKVPRPEPIEALLERLQAVLAGTPPPWLRKALLRDRVRDPAEFDGPEGDHE